MESVVVAGVDWPGTLAAAADRACASLELVDRERWSETVGVGADGTPTAAIDAAAEAALLDYLADALPGATLCSEEAGIVAGAEAGAGSGFLLVVDPVDGTNNLLAGIPYWAVSIGVSSGAGALGGLVRDGATGEDFFGWAGHGLCRGGAAAATSAVTALSEAAVALQRPADPGALDRGRRMFEACRLPRVLGAAALDLALVATGALDAYVNVNTDPALPFGERVVDYAAGATLVQIGGGVVSDATGAPVTVDADLSRRTPLVAAATPSLHAQILERLHRERELT